MYKNENKMAILTLKWGEFLTIVCFKGIIISIEVEFLHIFLIALNGAGTQFFHPLKYSL